jgi:hypothetical protein
MAKKELAKKEATQEIQVYVQSESMGVADEVTSSDVQLPSLMLMQANSEIVKDRSNDIQSGDFVNSINNEVWGSIEEPVQVCVVDMFKTELITEGKKWISTRPWTPEMENMEYKFMENGIERKRVKCFNYICFRPLDIRAIEMPGADKQYVASPFVVKFKGGSGKNAKKFNQILRDYALFKQPSFAFTFDLKAYEDSNEHGTFFVYNMVNPKQAIEETQKAGAALLIMSKAARAKNQLEVIDAEEVTSERVVKDIPNHPPAVTGTIPYA